MKKTRMVIHEFPVDKFLKKLGIDSDKVVAVDDITIWWIQSFESDHIQSIKVALIEEAE